MTILARLEKYDKEGNVIMELTCCGTPSKAWLDWLLTATVPLTAGQMAWREIHREGIEKERRHREAED